MKYLIDTHVLVWYLDGHPSLSKATAYQLDDAEKLVVSIVSLWELTIKTNIKKIELSSSLKQIQHRLFDDSHFKVLDISFDHLNILSTLDHHHRDPFDRLLISTALFENLTVVTADREFKAYPIKVFW